MTKQLTPRRVVITGMGLVTPLAVGTEESWQAVVNGVSGCNEITLVDHADFKVHFAHEVKDFEPTDWFNDPKTAKRCDRFVHFAVASAKMAWKDAALPADFDSTRVGCVYASGIGGILSIEEQYRKFSTKGPNRVSPFTIPLLMTNCSSGQIAIELGLQGPNYTPVSACASGGHAIGLAMRHIQWGEADIMLTGGAEAGISELGLCGFANMKALSTRNDDPKTASRPFDKDRDGFVMGEGGGALVLESLESAQARGATIYAEVLGYGFTDDAHHITAPNECGEGGTRAMKIAIENADITPDQINYINAHGTSTPYNDKIETLAIKQALGAEAASKVSVSSTKGCTGHMLGAAGAVEAVFGALALRDQVVPPTINHCTPDPECDLDITPNEKNEREINYVLSNSLGFGGHNVALCLGRV